LIPRTNSHGQAQEYLVREHLFEFLLPILTRCSSPNTVNDGSQNEPGRESGATTHSGGLTGEGSHLAQTHDTPAGTTSGLAGNQTSGVTDTGAGSHLAQAHDTPAGNTSGFTGNQTSGFTDTGNTSGLTGNQTSGVTDTGEGSHLAHANDTPAGNTSGFTGNQTSGVTNTSNTSGHDHLARDATVAAGGAGLAEQ
jgi:hypothetical protein